MKTELSNLATKLDNEQEEDTYLLYLAGVVFNRMENAAKARHYLVKSIKRNPYVWSAWQELAKTIERLEEVTRI